MSPSTEPWSMSASTGSVPSSSTSPMGRSRDPTDKLVFLESAPIGLAVAWAALAFAAALLATTPLWLAIPTLTVTTLLAVAHRCHRNVAEPLPHQPTTGDAVTHAGRRAGAR